MPAVYLGNGTTDSFRDISQDGGGQCDTNHLEDYIPETKPYDVALRITKDGNHSTPHADTGDYRAMQ